MKSWGATVGLDIVTKGFCCGFEELVILKKNKPQSEC